MELKKFIVMFGLLAILLSSSIAAERMCFNNDVWDFDSNGNPVTKLEDCGEDEMISTICSGDSVFETYHDRGCRSDSCYSAENVRLKGACGPDGCYDNEFRNYSCTDNGCEYTVVKEGDSDHDGIDDACDTCIDKNHNGICAGEDDCDSCQGGDADTSILDVMDCGVKINGREILPDRTVYKVFDRGEKIEIDVELVSMENAEDVQISAMILGYEHGDKERDEISDMTPVFNMKANRSYMKSLELTIPDDIDTGDLKVRLIISDRFHTTWYSDYNLDVNAQSHKLSIKDILLDPSGQIEGGSVLFARARVRNLGEDTEDSIRVEFEIPGLDIYATEYLDELSAGSTETTDEISLIIPDCPEPGNYTVNVTAIYDDDYEQVSSNASIEVVDGPGCVAPSRRPTGTTASGASLSGDTGGSIFDERTVVTVPGSQDIVTGTSGAVYPVMITNYASVAKTYVISLKGVEEWGSYRIDPSAVVIVQPGKTEVPYVYVSAKDTAVPGAKTIALEVSSGGDAQQAVLSANVIKGPSQMSGTTGSVVAGLSGSGISMEMVLLIGVVFVLLIGLMAMFGKMKEKQ